MKVFSDLKDFFFSKNCPFCNQNINFQNYYVCDNCKENLFFDHSKSCRKCGRYMDITEGDYICHSCRNTKLYFDRNVSALKYSETVRTAVLDYKFHNAPWMSSGFGEMMAETIKEVYENYSFDCIIPVPISIYRYVNRGYDQCELIAGVISKKLGIPLYNKVLFKMTDNVAQSTLNHNERIKNVKGVYKVFNEEMIIDKSILLIDDIFTTGSTINECSKILKEYGAFYVGCCTLAYVGY